MLLHNIALKHPKLQASVNFFVSGCFPGFEENFFRLCFKLQFPFSSLGGRFGKMIKRVFSRLVMSQFSSLIKIWKAFGRQKVRTKFASEVGTSKNARSYGGNEQSFSFSLHNI